MGGLRDRSALEFFHHQEPGHRQIPVHARDGEAIVAFEPAPHPLDVFGLLAEVEFAVQRRGQVLEHGLHVDNLIQTGALPNFLSKYLEQSEVLLDRLACRWPLYLDNDPVATRQRRTLDLGNGAGRKGFRIDRIEHVLPRHPEFLLHDLDSLFLGHWRDVVLQRRRGFLDVLGRQEVRARRQNLPKLRVGRAEFLERSSQSLGLPATAGRALLVGPSEQFPQAMFAHHRRDLRAPRHQPGLRGRGRGASDHGRCFRRCAIADRGGVLHDDHDTASVMADS